MPREMLSRVDDDSLEVARWLIDGLKIHGNQPSPFTLRFYGFGQALSNFGLRFLGSVKLQTPFGLSLSKPRTTLRQAQSERVLS